MRQERSPAHCASTVSSSMPLSCRSNTRPSRAALPTAPLAVASWLAAFNARHPSPRLHATSKKGTMSERMRIASKTVPVRQSRASIASDRRSVNLSSNQHDISHGPCSSRQRRSSDQRQCSLPNVCHVSGTTSLRLANRGLAATSDVVETRCIALRCASRHEPP